MAFFLNKDKQSELCFYYCIMESEYSNKHFACICINQSGKCQCPSERGFCWSLFKQKKICPFVYQISSPVLK